MLSSNLLLRSSNLAQTVILNQRLRCGFLEVKRLHLSGILLELTVFDPGLMDSFDKIGSPAVI
jgi:hypothetical protein